jgi:peptidylprolyl isomerase
MAQAKEGDTIQVHYTGTLKDGTVFDTSQDREPLEFTLGNGDVIPGFEKAVLGLAVGEKRKVEIPCDEAYGPHASELMMAIDRSQFPADQELTVGQTIPARLSSGPTLRSTIVEISETQVTLDANHPLAGEDLTFDIELVSIRSKD